MTQTEWDRVYPLLYPGCTFLYDNDSSIGKVFINPDGTGNFSKDFPAGSTSWLIPRKSTWHTDRISNACHPDGTPLVKPLSKEERVCMKIKQLDIRFKNKTLPRCSSVSFLKG